MPIRVIPSDLEPDDLRQLREAVMSARFCQRTFRLELGEERPGISDWESCRAYAASLPADRDCVIAVTSRRLSDNWFSHNHPQCCLISTNGLYELLHDVPNQRPSTAAFLLEELVLALYCQTTGLGEEQLVPHCDIYGCAMDLCLNKRDILLVLYSGYMCSDHAQLFRNHGGTHEQLSALARLLDLTRARALGREDEMVRLGAYTPNQVFIVHGHDHQARETLADMLREWGLEPVAIVDEPYAGRTIMQQVERHARVGYAMVLLTPDDKGRLAVSGERLQLRARQNVVLEYGYFAGLLGRDRICLLVKGHGIELPSDLGAVLSINFEDSVEEARDRIRLELEAAGYWLAR